MNFALQALQARFVGAELRPFDRNPVILVQWGPPGEVDEVSNVRNRLSYSVEEQWGSDLIPNVDGERVMDPSREELVRVLRRYLCENPSVQTLFVSAHGTDEGLWYEHSSGDCLTYREFGQILGVDLPREGVTLVMGSCGSFARTSTLIENLPFQVTEVYGFTDTPRGSHVAALVLAVELRRTMEYSEIREVVQRHELLSDATDMRRDLDAILDALETTPERPEEFVDGVEGVAIHVYRNGRLTRSIRLET